MARQRIIKGVSVSSGLALGPVHVVRAAPNAVPHWCVPELDLPAELARFREALETAAEQLSERRRIVAQQAGRKDGEIFAVHRAILLDPKQIDRVESTISDQRINAEAAVQAHIDDLRRIFRDVPDSSVRGTAEDVADPWNHVLEVLMERESESFASTDERVVLAAAELTPKVVTCVERDRILAVITEKGGRFSHGAVLARSFGVPCLVEVPNLLSRLEQGMRVLVDGDQAIVQLRPEQEDIDQFLEARARRAAREQVLAVHAALPAVTSDGGSLGVMVNIESVRDLDTFQIEHTDGVGLLRTEFLYLERAEFPSEEEQYRLYRRVVERMLGRPMTLRTLDIGGDKPLPYFRTPVESNPALGWRGLRISLEWPDLLRVQMRAALRASAHGNLRILLPMVSSLEEVLQVREMFHDVRAQLLDQGYEVAKSVPVGVMIEVPSSLIALPHILDEIDFVSVGTNDLVQYLLSVDRDNPLVAARYDTQHPAVVWALRRVADLARRAGKPSSVCGEMAGDYATALLLMGFGYDAVSVAPRFVPHVKYAVRETTFAEASALAAEVAQKSKSREVRDALDRVRDRLHRRQLDNNARGITGAVERGDDGAGSTRTREG